MKLKVGWFNQDIAENNGTSRRKVSTLFRRLLPIIAKSLTELIICPERQIIRSNMPTNFKMHFSDCVCIFDCTEIFTDRRKDLTTRAQVFSSYKNDCTLKYLLGIIDFLSHISYGELVIAD